MCQYIFFLIGASLSEPHTNKLNDAYIICHTYSVCLLKSFCQPKNAALLCSPHNVLHLHQQSCNTNQIISFLAFNDTVINNFSRKGGVFGKLVELFENQIYNIKPNTLYNYYNQASPETAKGQYRRSLIPVQGPQRLSKASCTRLGLIIFPGKGWCSNNWMVQIIRLITVYPRLRFFIVIVTFVNLNQKLAKNGLWDHYQTGRHESCN